VVFDSFAKVWRYKLAHVPSSKMLKNPSNPSDDGSFRGAAGNEESRKSFVSKAGFLSVG
jgi:hypothetical protein